MRHHDMAAIAAGGPGAERARGQTEQLVTPLADRARAAADPRVDGVALADLDTLRSRPRRHHLAGNLVAHGEGQLHAALLQGHLVAPAEIEVAVPDVHVAVTDPGGFDAHEDLLAGGLRRRVLTQLQRLAPLDDLHGAHWLLLVLRAVVCGRS
jgi:hypothetical protein